MFRPIASGRGYWWLPILASAPWGMVQAMPFAVETRVLHVVPSVAAMPAYAGGWRSGSLAMPFVVGGRPGVAERINEALYLDRLGLPAPLKKAATFDLDPSGLSVQTSVVRFTATRNRPMALLTVTFVTDACTPVSGVCGPEFSYSLNFDTRFGRRVSLADLLTNAAAVPPPFSVFDRVLKGRIGTAGVTLDE